MKVLFLSTSDVKGGAAIASFRLFQALKKTGVDINMLVAEKYSSEDNVTSACSNIFKKANYKTRYYLEKTYLFRQLKESRDIFFFSSANFGIDVSLHPLVLQADIIHYHWINHAFLSIENLKKIMALGKPVVCHLHDMWAFTGGCHYTGDCNNFITGCGNCPMLKQPHHHDLSSSIIKAKKELYQAPNLHFVASSQYLKNIADQSLLLHLKKTQALPIPIDTNTFKRKNVIQARKKFGISLDKTILLFGSQNVVHKRKGFHYFVEAINLLAAQNNDFRKNAEVVVFGKTQKDLQPYLNIQVKSLGTLHVNELNDVYSAADAYIIPSLEDNLPNTVLESLACETPVVAFHTGGIPEMVTHQVNGYLATYKSVESLAEGIMWTISHRPKAKLNENIYGEASVSKKYIEYYAKLLNIHLHGENTSPNQTFN
jgi:glycosyltransferase involved in cell wall biosynthesis